MAPAHVDYQRHLHFLHLFTRISHFPPSRTCYTCFTPSAEGVKKRGRKVQSITVTTTARRRGSDKKERQRERECVCVREIVRGARWEVDIAPGGARWGRRSVRSSFEQGGLRIRVVPSRSRIEGSCLFTRGEKSQLYIRRPLHTRATSGNER